MSLSVVKLEIYKNSADHTYDSLSAKTKVHWRTLADWCQKGYTAVLRDGELEEIHRPEKKVWPREDK